MLDRKNKLKRFLSLKNPAPITILLMALIASAALMSAFYQGGQKAHAAPTNCYWLGTTSTSWNTAANWSDTPEGPGGCNGGANVPGSETTVIFGAGTTDNNAALDVTTTVADVTINAGYSGTITLADNAFVLTASNIVMSGGAITIVAQGAARIKLVASGLTVAGGIFTQNNFSFLDINGDFAETSGTFTGSGNSRVSLSGNFNYTSGTFTQSGSTTSTYGWHFDGNSSEITNAPPSFGRIWIEKTAGQTLTLKSDLTLNSEFRYTSGTFDTTTNSHKVTFTGDANIYPGGITFYGITVSAAALYLYSDVTITNDLTIGAGKKLTLKESSILTLNDTARLTLGGTLTSYNINPGTIIFKDDAATYIPAAGGTLGGKIKIIAETKDIILPGRNYLGRLELNNNSGSLRTVTFGSAGGQTFNIGNDNYDTEFGSGLYLSADGDGNLILDASANDPTVNLIAVANTKTVGHIDYTGTSLVGNETIKAGDGTWSLVGNMDLTGGSLERDASTFRFNGTGSQTQTLTSNGQSFDNLTVANTNATGFTFADGSEVTGTFRDTTATSKVTFHSTSTYTIANINIAGTSGAGNTVTLKSSTGASAALFNVSQTNPTTSYVTVSDSNASGGNAINATDGTNTNGGGNTFWNFVAVIPAAPTIGIATAGNAQASVTFTPPTDNGGSPITGYTVTSDPDSHTGLGAGSPIVVGSLTNGTSYTFTVHATNAIGNSLESDPSNPVTPSTIPGAPTGATATGGNGKATITFTPPIDDGGSIITGYTVTSTPGSFTGTDVASPIDVNGLTNGTSYTFTVHATNANGNGPESVPSNAIIPTPAPTPTPTSTPDSFDHLNISPTQATIDSDATQSFSAEAIDTNGNAMSGAIFSWSASCGSIKSSGLFSTNGLSGQDCTVSVGSNYGGSASATVHINDNTCNVQITPKGCTSDERNNNECNLQINMSPGETKQFSATTERTDVTYSWSVFPSYMATVDDSGNVTVTNKADYLNSGGFSVNVNASCGGSDSSYVFTGESVCNYDQCTANAKSCDELLACAAECGVNVDNYTVETNLAIPSGGESYYFGDQIPVTWTQKAYDTNGNPLSTFGQSFGGSPLMRMSVSTDSGQSYQFVQNLYPTTDTSLAEAVFESHKNEPFDYYDDSGLAQSRSAKYNWTVPANPNFVSKQVRIKLEPITPASCSVTFLPDASDANFTIDGIFNPNSVLITPASASIKPENTRVFTATVYDESGKDVSSSSTFSWSVSNGGTISSGTNARVMALLAGSDERHYPNAIKVIANYQGHTTFAYASFTVGIPTLKGVIVSPYIKTLGPLQSYILTANPIDQFGNPFSDATITWDLSDPTIGELTPNDPLTATFTGTKAGCFSDVIKATATYKDASFYDVVSVRVSDKELFITRVLEKLNPVALR